MRPRGIICQYGSGLKDYPVYRGVSRQYGNGLGSIFKKVQVGKDQEKAQSEKDSHSKNRGGKKLN